MNRIGNYIKNKITYYMFERKNRLETTGNVNLKELNLNTKERHSDIPSGWQTLKKLSKVVNFTENDVFIDFGSGKGRIVYMAAHYPFKRVIGVEISEKLNNIAKANIQRNIGKFRCKNIELIDSDVIDYKIPDDITKLISLIPLYVKLLKVL